METIINRSFFEYPESTIVYLVMVGYHCDGAFKTKAAASNLAKVIAGMGDETVKIVRATVDSKHNFVVG